MAYQHRHGRSWMLDRGGQGIVMSTTYADYTGMELLPGRCVIRPAREPSRVGSIEVPEQDRERQTWGQVVNIGEWGEDVIPGQFKVGDYVLFDRWAGYHALTRDKVVLVICRQDSVLAVIEGGPND